MNRVRLIIFCSFIACLILHGSCTPGGPLTPKESLAAIAAAYKNRNAKAIFSLLTTESRTRLQRVSEELIAMPLSQKRAVAPYLKIKEKDLITINPVFLIQRYIDQKDNLLGKILGQSTVGVEIQGKTAHVRFTHGMELVFIKEDPYWYLSFNNL